jgi:multiple sugar transport system ATP-binding protein
MRAEIRRLHDALDATIVYVTHDQTEAMTLGDRIALLRAGELVQCDTPEEIHAHPATAFVGSFIGSPEMNLVRGEIGPEGLVGPGYRLDVSRPERREVLVGVRPEHVSIASNGQAVFHGDVALVESTGSEAFVHVDTEAGRVVCKLGDRPKPHIGEHVGLAVDRRHIHLFDRATEARIS